MSLNVFLSPVTPLPPIIHVDPCSVPPSNMGSTETLIDQDAETGKGEISGIVNPLFVCDESSTVTNQNDNLQAPSDDVGSGRKTSDQSKQNYSEAERPAIKGETLKIADENITNFPGFIPSSSGAPHVVAHIQIIDSPSNSLSKNNLFNVKTRRSVSDIRGLDISVMPMLPGIVPVESPLCPSVPRRSIPSLSVASYGMDSLTVPGIPAMVTAVSGLRRQSLSSMDSDSSTLLSDHPTLKPLTLPDIPQLDTLSLCDPRTPMRALRSPGGRSMLSVWSDTLTPRPRKKHFLPTENNSWDTNSLSDISSNLSDRMRQLVRAFSSRTQNVKELNEQPPTPSSIDSMEARSVSAMEELPVQARHRLDSFIPAGSHNSSFTIPQKEQDEIWVGVGGCNVKIPTCLRKIECKRTFEPQSKLYLFWLGIVTLVFMYNVGTITLRGVFPYQTPENLIYWLAADYFADFIYILDIFAFKMNMRFIEDGMLQKDPKITRRHYMRKVMFKMDVASLIPLDLLYLAVGVNPWLRLPRILKLQTFWEFYDRCDQMIKSAHALRVLRTMTYMLFLIHIETCGYYAMSVYEGINTNRWVYNGTGIAYIRCFYLATKTATSIGNNPKPTNTLEYAFMTLYWLSGVFVFALLIGQIRDIFDAANQVKSDYRKRRDITIWYMKSINLPNEMQDRVRMWFNYNWDQQKTLDENKLLVSLPSKMKKELAINVHYDTLSKVQLFQDCDKNLLYDLVLKLKPLLCLPGDFICRKGEVGKEMYIVSKGQVEVVAGPMGEVVLATLHYGSVFGEISLLALTGGNRRTADVRSKGFTNLFILNKADFEAAMMDYPEAQVVLRRRAKKLLSLNARREQTEHRNESDSIIHSPKSTPKMVKAVIQLMNPHSDVIKKIGCLTKKEAAEMLDGDDDGGHDGLESDVDQENDDDDDDEHRRSSDSSEISLTDILEDNRGDSLDDAEEDEILHAIQMESRISIRSDLKTLLPDSVSMPVMKSPLSLLSPPSPIQPVSASPMPLPGNGAKNMSNPYLADYTVFNFDTDSSVLNRCFQQMDSKDSFDSGVQSVKNDSGSPKLLSPTLAELNDLSYITDTNNYADLLLDSPRDPLSPSSISRHNYSDRPKSSLRRHENNGGSAKSNLSMRNVHFYEATSGMVPQAQIVLQNGLNHCGPPNATASLLSPTTPRSSVSLVPLENRITCSAEIHREQTLVTPASQVSSDVKIGQRLSTESMKGMKETKC